MELEQYLYKKLEESEQFLHVEKELRKNLETQVEEHTSELKELNELKRIQQIKLIHKQAKESIREEAEKDSGPIDIYKKTKIFAKAFYGECPPPQFQGNRNPVLIVEENETETEDEHSKTKSGKKKTRNTIFSNLTMKIFFCGAAGPSSQDQEVLTEALVIFKNLEKSEHLLRCEKEATKELDAQLEELLEKLSEFDEEMKNSLKLEETKRLEEPVNNPNELQMIEKMLEEMLSQNKAYATNHKGDSVGNYTEFSFGEMAAATNDFSEALKIGEGGFSCVYKGFLRHQAVAIKMLKFPMNEGFNQEVNVLKKITHPNIIKLIGTCLETGILVYEFVPNGSLDDHLRKVNTKPFRWKTRIRIALDVCSALIYLHTMEPHGIVHGDIKPCNVILDSNDLGKLTDFGISRELSLTKDSPTPSYLTDTIAGTFSYIDPAYLSSGLMTTYCDIYSLGIMLLELVCGDVRILKGNEWTSIREATELGLESHTLDDLVDVSANWPLDVAKEMVILGLNCSEISLWRRPQAKDVWIRLKSIEVSSSHEISDLPKESSF